MKFKFCLIALSFCFISSVVYSVQKSPHNLNAEPVEGTQGRYFPAIKFKSIDSVSVSTMLPAESLGRKRETIILPRNQWIYDDKTGLIEVKRKIDNSAYIVRAEGKFETPLCVMVTGGEKASNIRFVCNGKIGKAGTDYSYDEKKNEIKLILCVKGDEKYMLQYSTSKGACSIGSMSSADMTREIRAYFEWPLDGNATAIDDSCRKFSSKNVSFKGVWLVQLLPKNNGYFGKDIINDFKWDAVSNVLILSEPVDTDKYDVYIFGEEKSQDN
ncbi:MAG TPA: hypothetical protein PK624_03980 [Spirochaetota bacterium]|nr:hypothetical protein [Spirochaetota bacterium]HOR43933.1 hypothetical protein [Spirochaetota bacterium]HOU85057.1 hypothetical protein [Spirochaetota bacterium]HPK55357.1 hypothetical protein [Spirochaetota bacterium]HQE59445.1 hypothetical protein [Spirochaetota bacterium]